MLTEERHKIILDTLAKDNIVKLQDLVDETGSSESTIRRDLSTLEEAGFLIRVHGGAKRNYSVSAEDRMEDKTSKNVRDKQRIAEKAAQLVSDQDIIFLDAGSTTYEMIPFLKGKSILVVTNGVPHASLLSDMQIETILIGGIVIGALIVLGIVYGVLNSTVFSAKSVAQSYLTAIADGKYDKANDIADPQVDKDQLKLLSDTVAKADNATIANPHIDSVKTVEGVAKVNVTYSLNGKNVNDSLTINKDGSKFLLFPNWKISSPLLKTITVSVPNAVESLSVNGVDVTAKNAEKSDSGTWTLRVYPGSYKVSIGKSGYVTSGITMVRTNADSDAADLKIMPTAKLKEDLSKAVNAKLDECAKSTDYAPEGCPFGFDLYDEDYYRNFAWSISVYPKLSDIDLDYGTFSTRQGKAKCTYEEKNFDDSWESQDDSTHFTVNGSFSIRDGKLSVTIDDED